MWISQEAIYITFIVHTWENIILYGYIFPKCYVENASTGIFVGSTPAGGISIFNYSFTKRYLWKSSNFLISIV